MKIRENIIIKGIVQGVGFRPFIHKLVQNYNLSGWVLNSNQGVEIDVEGEMEELNSFVSDIKVKLPPLARIEKIEVNQLHLIGYKGFSIKKSITKEENGFVLVSPDISICEDCLQELFDPRNRRFHYPFINCTNCGPRFTIIKDIPYDRGKTTMRVFEMCPQCQSEYENIEDRRYHAQPNACAECGPQVFLYQNKRKLENVDPVKEAVKLLKDGKIGAIKGLGGFHLACDATNNEVVTKLRLLKNREAKPFAIMSFNLEKIKQYCKLGKKEEKWLINRARPIVLLKKKEDSLISSLVAPRNNYLGVMLPYTPLHCLLLKDNFTALIMTSGNIADQPIIGDNQEALEKLDGIADFFLLYNRDIFNRCDDSVVKIVNDGNVFFRRSRGYVPYPIILDFKLKEVLALGGELKNTISFSKENYVFLSQYLGDLKSVETLNFLKESIENLEKIFRVNPETIACDLHPDYLSTQFAEEIGAKKGLKVVKVQHHHAHIVSCMAENNIKEKVMGVAYDGTGYGDDGKIWGGEFLLCDLKKYFRVGHLKYYPLPGGDKAIEEPWRMAYSYLYSIYGPKAKTLDIDFNHRMDYDKLSIIEKMIDKNINSPLTSSCGRLFDAASSLIGIRDEINYEGQAAMELESLCASGIKERYKFCIYKEGKEFIIDPKEIFVDIIEDLKKGIDKKVMAAKFHNTVAEFTLNLCGKIRENNGINKIALSGGVFQNRYLTEKIISLLERDNFRVYTQRKVPPNDGGISLGQAVVAGYK
ncbi:carbamoyltransferase HypF [Candidatus Atribacteria bacterium MT.SAG.1]|nr:carbamoyltransferase HypF [Candidatus Atribacteria bacterium MT.SAG.1]